MKASLSRQLEEESIILNTEKDRLPCYVGVLLWDWPMPRYLLDGAICFQVYRGKVHNYSVTFKGFAHQIYCMLEKHLNTSPNTPETPMYKGFEHGEVLLQHLTKHLTNTSLNTSPIPHQHFHFRAADASSDEVVKTLQRCSTFSPTKKHILSDEVAHSLKRVIWWCQKSLIFRFIRVRFWWDFGEVYGEVYGEEFEQHLTIIFALYIGISGNLVRCWGVSKKTWHNRAFVPKTKKEKCSDLYPKSLNNNLKAAEHFYEMMSAAKWRFHYCKPWVSLRQTYSFLTANLLFRHSKCHTCGC